MVIDGMKNNEKYWYLACNVFGVRNRKLCAPTGVISDLGGSFSAALSKPIEWSLMVISKIHNKRNKLSVLPFVTLAVRFFRLLCRVCT